MLSWQSSLGYKLPVTVNWSDELEELHEESSRTHFIDVWTRRAMLDRIGSLPFPAQVADIGCSSGYLLEDLRSALPTARLVGVDGVYSGLARSRDNVSGVVVLQSDVCQLPLADGCLDALLSANLLEHVSDDVGALAELHRVLRPGARAVIVVPRGPEVYDYYDRFLHHVRRYGRGELATKARAAGFQVLQDLNLGAPLYPAFWLVKKANRLRFSHLEGTGLEEKVSVDIAKTKDSRLGHLACELERNLLGLRVSLPFGIRGLTVLQRRVQGAK